MQHYSENKAYFVNSLSGTRENVKKYKHGEKKRASWNIDSLWLFWITLHMHTSTTKRIHETILYDNKHILDTGVFPALGVLTRFTLTMYADILQIK